MVVVILAALALGVIMGRTLTVFVLIPVGVLAGFAGVGAARITEGNEELTIAASVVALQAGYLLGVASNECGIVLKRLFSGQAHSKRGSEMELWKADRESKRTTAEPKK